MAVISRPRDGALLVSEYTDPPHRTKSSTGRSAVTSSSASMRPTRCAGSSPRRSAQPLTDLTRLDVLENIFGWHGHTEHEVVFIFTAAFADPAAYEIREQPILDNAGRRVIWRPADAASPPLYPAGLTELIRSAG